MIKKSNYIYKDMKDSFTLICSTMFVGSLVGRVLGSCNLGFCIRVETSLKCLFLFYLFFADKKNIYKDRGSS